MREEADDRGSSLELSFQLGNERQGFCVRIVQVEDDQAGTVLFTAGCQLREDFFVILDERDPHAKVAGGLLDLGEEEQVLDEEEDLRRCVFGDGNSSSLRIVDRL